MLNLGLRVVRTQLRQRPLQLAQAFHASAPVLGGGRGMRPKKSPYMNWKRRAALSVREKELVAAERKAAGLGVEDAPYEGALALTPIPKDAVDITFPELMDMLMDEKHFTPQGSPEEIRAKQKADWRLSRKLVNTDALFAPRGAATVSELQDLSGGTVLATPKWSPNYAHQKKKRVHFKGVYSVPYKSTA